MTEPEGRLTTSGRRLSSKQPDEADWKDLLFRIEKGNVIPIVGRDLLVVDEPEGKRRSLYRELASELADALEIDRAELPAEVNIEDVVRRFLEQRDADRSRPYGEMRELVEKLSGSTEAIPTPLRSLARIKPIQYFVSTTFDDLLARALRSEGATVREYAYTPLARSEDVPPHLESGEVAVYYLLGRPAGAGDYVVTEEDTLELVHGLQTKLELAQGELKQLGAQLQKKQLLFLGCGFPDWLMRFFIRTLRGQQFSAERERPRTRVADERAGQGDALAAFLLQCGARVYAEGAADFVQQLEERWSRRHSALAAPIAGRAAASPRVLLACAAEDAERVQPVADKLKLWGIEHEIVGLYDAGDSARDLLDGCVAYIAFLSQRAFSRGGEPDPRLVAAWNLVEQRTLAPGRKPLCTRVILLDQVAQKRHAERRAWPSWQRSTRKLYRPSSDDVLALRIVEAMLAKQQLDLVLPLRLYCIYADEDERIRRKFEEHLSLSGWFKIWHRKLIPPGGNGAAMIAEELGRADVIIPLLSVALFSSEGQDSAARQQELEYLRESGREGRALVVGVRARACVVDQLELDVLPPTDEPIYGREGQTEADTDPIWTQVIEELLLKVCDHFLRPPLPGAAGGKGVP